MEIAKAVAESRQKAEARRAVGGTSDAAADAAGSSAADGGLGSSATAPAIVVSTEPAELLVFGGEPSWAPLTGTDLLVAMNTPGDVFVEISTQRRFVLLAGRWFVAQSLDGPWSFVAADQLPADFATIPPGDRQGPTCARASPARRRRKTRCYRRRSRRPRPSTAAPPSST
ncbi:MAG: hypothetical protein IPK07_24185 [Deltaproteobacteria bacterium]|nr:hypothetical protein [Deltaproteobacteria bacterium]